MTDEAPAQPGPRRVGIDIAAQIFLRTLNLGLGIAVTLVLARHLGVAGFGYWSTIFAVVQIALSVGDLGLEPVAVRRAAAEPKLEGSWVGALVTLRFALSIPVTLIAAVVLVAIAENDQMLVAGLILCAELLVAPLSMLRVVFQLRVRNDINTAFELANGILWAVAAIVIASAGGGLVALMIGFVVAAVLTTGLQAVLALRRMHVHMRGSSSLWPALARAGSVVGIGTLLTLAYGRIDQVLVLVLGGSDDAGQYGAVYRVLDRAQLIPAAFLSTLFPILVRAYTSDRALLRRVFQLGFDYLTVFSLGALAFTIAAAKPLVEALFGPGYSASAPALPVLMGAFVVISCGYLVGNMVIVLGLQARFAIYAVAALVFNVVANLLLIPPYGFVAAAWVTLATEILVMGATARSVFGKLGWWVTFGRVLRAAAAAGLMGLAVWALRQAGVPLAALVVAAAVIYPLLLLAFRGIRLEEISAILRRQVA